MMLTNIDSWDIAVKEFYSAEGNTLQGIEGYRLAGVIPGVYTPPMTGKPPTLGQNIRAVMDARNLKQWQLADRLKVRQPSVNKVLHGRNAKMTTLLDYAKVLECPVEVFLRGVDTEYGAMLARIKAEPEKNSELVTLPVQSDGVQGTIPGEGFRLVDSSAADRVSESVADASRSDLTAIELATEIREQSERLRILADRIANSPFAGMSTPHQAGSGGDSARVHGGRPRRKAGKR